MDAQCGLAKMWMRYRDSPVGACFPRRQGSWRPFRPQFGTEASRLNEYVRAAGRIVSSGPDPRRRLSAGQPLQLLRIDK